MEPILPTPGVPGQDPSLVDVMERNVAALVRTSAVLVKLSERLDTIEGRLKIGEGDGGAPITERRPIGQLGRLALRQDGRLLLEVTNDLEAVDLLDRDVGRYVVLHEAEAADCVDRADIGFADAASRAAWQIGRSRKGYADAPKAPPEEQP